MPAGFLNYKLLYIFFKSKKYSWAYNTFFMTKQELTSTFGPKQMDVMKPECFQFSTSLTVYKT